jgi:hypothetical protein
VLGRERVEGEHVVLGLLEQAAIFGSRRCSWPTASRSRSRAWLPSEAVNSERMSAPSASCWSVRTWPREIAQEVHGAALATARPGPARAPPSSRGLSDEVCVVLVMRPRCRVAVAA